MMSEGILIAFWGNWRCLEMFLTDFGRKIISFQRFQWFLGGFEQFPGAQKRGFRGCFRAPNTSKIDVFSAKIAQNRPQSPPITPKYVWNTIKHH